MNFENHLITAEVMSDQKTKWLFFFWNTVCTSPGDGQTSCTVWLASHEWRHCSYEGKTWN